MSERAKERASEREKEREREGEGEGEGEGRRARGGEKDSGSMKLTTRLYHITHCKIASRTNLSNRWTYDEHSPRLDRPEPRTSLSCLLLSSLELGDTKVYEP